MSGQELVWRQVRGRKGFTVTPKLVQTVNEQSRIVIHAKKNQFAKWAFKHPGNVSGMVNNVSVKLNVPHKKGASR